MKSKAMPKKYSIKVTVIGLFFFLSGLILTVALSMQYYSGQNLAQNAATEIFHSAATSVSEKVASLDAQASELVHILSGYPNIDHPISNKDLHPITSIMARALLQKQFLYAAYIGYENGDFYELINLDSDKNLREKLGASINDRWVVIKIFNGKEERQRVYEFYDKDFILTEQHSEPSDYYANLRPWYQKALESEQTIKTEPYMFHNIQAPGVTYAQKVKGSKNVFAVDITLNTLSKFLSNTTPFNDGESMLFDTNGKIIAHSFDIKPTNNLFETSKPVPLSDDEKEYIKNLGVLKVSNELNWPPFDFSYSGYPQGYSIDIMNLVAQKLGLSIQYSNGYVWGDILSLFAKKELDIVHSIFYTEFQKEMGLYSKPYLKIPVALITRDDSKKIMSLKEFDNKVVAIPSDWSIFNIIKKHYPLIKILSVKDTLEAFKAVSSGKAIASLENKQVAQYLIDVYSLPGLKIQNELDNMDEFEDISNLRMIVQSGQIKLQHLINRAIDSINDKERQVIQQKWINGSESSASIIRAVKAGVVPFKAYVDMAVQSDAQGFSLYETTFKDNDYTLYVKPTGTLLDSYIGFMVPTKVIKAPYMDKVRASVIITLALLLLLIPVLIYVSDIIVEPIKQLSRENRKIKHRDFSKVKLVPSNIVELSDLSTSMLSMSKSIEIYQKQQQEFMDSFIKLIAQAIDEKSPYTAGHCARVPAMAIMLAKQADESQSAAFSDFKMKNKDEWREFETAAWLHDCGKIVTPEYIVDKGSKLETIYNRIHEIRMRFEVLLRDAEIDYWQGIAQGEPSPKLQEKLEQRKQQIKDDFVFIAQCNVGSESMSDADIKRVEDISSYTWQRNLDDRLGLSPQEEHRLATLAHQALPVTENVLSDKQEHLISWLNNPKDRNSNDIKVSIPQYQKNLGEIYNLNIRKGTLTDEERYQINEHVIATIRILETLPLPEELKNMPEYAGGHHENLSGTGYPRKLKKENLSLKTRILALADVFEALTASDRPYKKAKSLNETVEILNRMVKDNHLDQDLFELMLTSGVYKKYAQEFLPESQIDEVDIERYISS